MKSLFSLWMAFLSALFYTVSGMMVAIWAVLVLLVVIFFAILLAIIELPSWLAKQFEKVAKKCQS